VKAHLLRMHPTAAVVIREQASPTAPPWWQTPAFLALADVRRAMVEEGIPSGPARTAEESARHAVFWAVFEIDHIVRELGRRVAAGESVRLRSGVYAYAEGRVDFGLRIVEHDEVEITARSGSHEGS
jgi:hypothetical protein